MSDEMTLSLFFVGPILGL